MILIPSVQISLILKERHKKRECIQDFNVFCTFQGARSLSHGIQPSLVASDAKSMEKETDDRKEEKQEDQRRQQRPQHHRQMSVAPLDEFTRLLGPDDARLLIDLLKLAVSGKNKWRLEGE